MNTDKNDVFDVLIDTYCKELVDMPDSEVLEGLTPGEAKGRGVRMIDAVKAQLAAEKPGEVKGQHGND